MVVHNNTGAVDHDTGKQAARNPVFRNDHVRDPVRQPPRADQEDNHRDHDDKGFKNF
jgi:hypothetical protein